METDKIKVNTLVEFPRPRTPGYGPMMLVVLAHPDDETFAVGGTLALHAAKGWKVKLVCVTNGEQSFTRLDELDAASYQKQRVAELRQAAKILGIGQLILMNWGDGKVARQRRVKAVADLLRVMIHTNPDVVITFGPDGLSGDPDHVAISRFTTAAFNQYRMPKVGETDEPRLYYVEPSSAPPNSFVSDNGREEALPVTTKIKIDSVWSNKVAAMQAYRSQKHLLTDLQEDKAAWMSREEFFYLVSPLDSKKV